VSRNGFEYILPKPTGKNTPEPALKNKAVTIARHRAK